MNGAVGDSRVHMLHPSNQEQQFCLESVTSTHIPSLHTVPLTPHLTVAHLSAGLVMGAAVVSGKHIGHGQPALHVALPAQMSETLAHSSTGLGHCSLQ